MPYSTGCLWLSGSSNNANKPKTVAEAKQQLREVTVSSKPDYLASIKERPLASVGVAFMAVPLLVMAEIIFNHNKT